MTFVDKQMYGGPIRKRVDGLAITKTAAMTLEVASGTVYDDQSGLSYTLGSAQSHVFTSDPTDPTRVRIAIIDDGVDTDLWVDEFVDDGVNLPGSPPTGFRQIHSLAWFDIPAGETDLDNISICRRILI